MRQLAQQGQNSVLTLFTQEGPNARFQHYEDQIHALKDEIDKRDALIADKDSLLEIRETERRFNDIGDAPHNSLNTPAIHSENVTFRPHSRNQSQQRHQCSAESVASNPYNTFYAFTIFTFIPFSNWPHQSR